LRLRPGQRERIESRVQMATSSRRPRQPDSRGVGQAIAEFALLLPAFLALTLGVVDGARLFGAYVPLTNAVREGALYASQWHHQTDTDGIIAIVDSEANGLDPAQITVTVTCDDGPCVAGSGGNVKVSASYQMRLAFTAVWGSSVHLGATVTARIIPAP
jgi:Flp pilus assembly protein TadG